MNCSPAPQFGVIASTGNSRSRRCGNFSRPELGDGKLALGIANAESMWIAALPSDRIGDCFVENLRDW
jgi:hypothetical protein